MVNYLANFHLLALLSPALRAQPPDRDVRVIPADVPGLHRRPRRLSQPLDAAAWTPGQAYARSKLALMTFGRAFQKHLDAQPRTRRTAGQRARSAGGPGLLPHARHHAVAGRRVAPRA